MQVNKRPVAVLIIAWLFIVVGVLGFGYHFRDLLALEKDILWAEATELLAVICGVYLLHARNWARWLAVAWALFHVILSVLDADHGVVVHSVLVVVIAWFLFRPDSGRYFRDNLHA